MILCYICASKDTNGKNALVLGVLTCLVEEIAHLLCDDIIRDWILGDALGIATGRRENYFNVLLYTVLLAALLKLLKGSVYRNDRSRLRMREVMVPFTSAIPFFYMRNYQYTEIKAGTVDRYIYLLLLLMAVLALFLILVNEGFLYEHIDRSEMEKLSLLLEQQRERYRMQEEVIRAVNRNYHDLKHVLTVLESGRREAETSEYVERLKKEIAPYESLQRTGNETLDVLLSAKLRQCREAGIRVNTYIDGRVCGFLRPLDLAVLFGNAFDNAREAAERVSEEAKREIDIRVGARRGRLLMRFENFYEGDRPDLKTIKADKILHGYGLSNMEKTAEKYQGVLTCETEGGRFVLTVMIPLPEEGKTVQ